MGTRGWRREAPWRASVIGWGAALAVALTLGAGCDKKAGPAPTPAAKAGPAAPAEAKPAEAKPAEAKPAEAKPAEAKPDEAKPAEAAEAKPAEAAEAKPDEAKAPPAEAVAPELCKAACDNALKITAAELKDVKPAMRAAIEKKLQDDCPKQCAVAGTKESVACITKAKSAAELAACPK